MPKQARKASIPKTQAPDPKQPSALGWYVEIWEFEGDKLERSLGPYDNERLADKADDGVNRNLNHDRFFTRIVSK